MANGFSYEVKSNKFDRAYRALVEAAADNVAETANDIEEEINSNIWSANIPVEIKKINPLLVHVKVGNRNRFYAGFLEWGTVDQAPKPVVIPAANRARPKFLAKAKSLERKAKFL